MIKRLVSQYAPSYPKTLVYMLQSTEYHTQSYFAWYKRLPHFFGVAKRRQLVRTKAALGLLLGVTLGVLFQLAAGVVLLALGWSAENPVLSVIGALVIVIYPFVWAKLIVLPLWLGRILIVKPAQAKKIALAETIFAKHPGYKIGVLGSYGKTSMKELLKTVLSEGKKVAVTPANKNVPISHAIFAEKLSGDEDILVIEYGEEKAGDIAAFARNTHPNAGVITGLAPAHLDQYGSLAAAGNDIFSINEFIDPERVYVNTEVETTKPYLDQMNQQYNTREAAGWKISNIKVALDGTSFEMHKDGQVLNIESGLLGRHQVGPLAVVAAVANEQGLTRAEIEKGTKKTKPFEHRMEPRPINGGWLIDDSYNGNIEGAKAGLSLLAELPAKRKTYVTPGLVDQGDETKRVHIAMGRAIAKAAPDKVVLMQNSVTDFIQQGMDEGDFQGEVVLETDPLDFYSNIQHFIAAGDVVMLQNDWTDNYN